MDMCLDVTDANWGVTVGVTNWQIWSFWRNLRPEHSTLAEGNMKESTIETHAVHVKPMAGSEKDAMRTGL